MNNEQNKIKKIFLSALQKQRENKLTSAELLYKKILKYAPNNVEVFNNLGLIYKVKKKTDKAIEFFINAIKLNPKYIHAYFNLANTYRENKNYNNAIDYFLKTINLDTNYINAYNNLGSLYIEIKEYKFAIENYKKALKINAKFEDAYFNIAISYEKLDEFDKAIEFYNKLIVINPNHYNALNNLGVIYAKFNNHYESISSFKKAIQINSNNVTSYYNLAKIYFKLENINEAINFLKKTIDINPNYINALNLLGLIYSKIGLFDKAISCYNRAIKIDPLNAQVYNNLGLIYAYEINDNQKGILFFKKSIELNNKYIEPIWNMHGCCSNIEEAINVLKKIKTIDKNHIEAKIMIAALNVYKNNFDDYNELSKSNHIDHPYFRSLKWLLSLEQLPKLFFKRWDFFDYMANIADKERPFYEFGVFYGSSFKYLLKYFKMGYGFDTFTGLPETWNKNIPKGSYSNSGKVPNIQGGELIVGKFEDTLPIFFSKKRSFASLINFDADLYTSTICALNNSKEIIDKKTILIFDEFLMNSNWENDEFKALNEFCKKNQYRYDVIAVSMLSKQVAIKILN